MSRSSTQIMRKYAIKEEVEGVGGGLNRCKETVNKVFIEDNKLTPEQIENWRRIFIMQFGPYALIMSPEEIQRVRDKMQKRINEIK